MENLKSEMLWSALPVSSHDLLLLQDRGNTTVEEDCSSQSSLLNIAYTLGIAMVGICGYPFGMIFDRYGLRVSRVIAR